MPHFLAIFFQTAIIGYVTKWALLISVQCPLTLSLPSGSNLLPRHTPKHEVDLPCPMIFTHVDSNNFGFIYAAINNAAGYKK